MQKVDYKNCEISVVIYFFGYWLTKSIDKVIHSLNEIVIKVTLAR